MSDVAVVGGGIAGASAALRLAEAGRQVVLFEGGDRLGGLVVSFEVGGTPLECFYHHVFPHERHILELIDSLGLAAMMQWLPSTMGVMTDGRIWPFTTPLDVLRFGPLSLPERLRMGIGGLALQRWRDWEQLDTVPAVDWLRRATGEAAVRELWAPLLRAKFGTAASTVPAAWMWGRFEQRRGARRGGGERLGYLRGGFRQLFDALAARLTQLGVDIRTNTRVARIDLDDGRVTGVVTDGGTVEISDVLYTGALPGISKLLPAELVDPRWREAKGLGVVCAVVETRKPITDVYWTNVCDESIGIGGIIEHTNLVPAEDYGRHVTYLGRYFAPGEDLATADPHQVVKDWIERLAGAYPRLPRAGILDTHVFKAGYAAPLVSLGYRDRIPPMLPAAVPGLVLATTAQIYPQDRGMSEGVRLGQTAAAAILARQPPPTLGSGN